MFKDKEWLKEQTKRLGEVPASGNDYFQEGWFEAYESFNKLIDQLDEPEQVIIPKFVAEWIKENKKETTDYDILNLGFDYVQHGFESKKVDDWIDGNENLFARAWLDDYTIEQPKLLTIIVKDYDKTIMSKQMPEDEVNKMMEGLEK